MPFPFFKKQLVPQRKPLEVAPPLLEESFISAQGLCGTAMIHAELVIVEAAYDKNTPYTEKIVGPIIDAHRAKKPGDVVFIDHLIPRDELHALASIFYVPPPQSPEETNMSISLKDVVTLFGRAREYIATCPDTSMYALGQYKKLLTLVAAAVYEKAGEKAGPVFYKTLEERSILSISERRR